MDSTNKDICFYSYNSRGSSNEKLSYVRNLIDLCGTNLPIFCVQEHFLLRNNIYKLSKFFTNSAVLAKPAYKNFQIQNSGRPSGGLATIIPKYLRKNIKVIECDSWRLQPFVMTIKKHKYLVINSYFPTDSRNINAECQDLQTVLSKIKVIMENTEFDTLALLGDINADFLRKSMHVNIVKEFIANNNLYSVWEDFNIDFTHVFQKENGECFTSTLDHFLFLIRSKSEILDAGVLHRVENCSDHEVTYTIVKKHVMEKIDENIDSEQQKFETKGRFHWNKANDDEKLEFQDALFRKLVEMNPPDAVINCSDVNCNDENHKCEIDTFVIELLENITDSGKETIPYDPPKNKSQSKSKKSTPGWKVFVEPFQDKAHLWHSIWDSAGRPINTELHRIMKKTRNEYHYQIRKCRRVEDFIRNHKIAQNCLENDADLFSEIKKQRANNNIEEVTIDGAAGQKIPNKFGEVYRELFNREKDEENVQEVFNSMKIDEHSLKEVNRINALKVKEAIDKIKPNKSDPIWEFSSDFLKNGPDVLYECLSKIIKAFIIHGHVTESLLIASMVPIVKDKLADLCSSKNYRSIAISSLLLKLLDWIIILNYGHLLKTNDFQFGFQQLSNTSLCSWMAYETIDHYIRNGSPVYGCLLDCTKAFDTVQHSLLFRKLLA